MKMNKRFYIFPVFLILLASFSSAVLINEFTADPQTDWDNSGNASSSDEWVELYNNQQINISLTNWTLFLNDTSPSTQVLSGTLHPGEYKVILNPAGTQNNDGQLLLYNASGNLVDSVSYGDWEDNNVSDNALDANANQRDDECLARIPDGTDTNKDADDFQKIRCTFGTQNGMTPPNEQDLNVTISGKIVFQVTPRSLEFGSVQPGSFSNPSRNGNITLNITGSTADVNVEITEVIGFPFDEGLKIDGEPALGKIWTILQSSPIQKAIPTLDIPLDAPAGNNHGTIVYTVSGAP